MGNFILSCCSFVFAFGVVFFSCFYYLFHLKFYIILAGDVKLNPGPFNGKGFKFCYCNKRGLRANLNDLSIDYLDQLT